MKRFIPILLTTLIFPYAVNVYVYNFEGGLPVLAYMDDVQITLDIGLNVLDVEGTAVLNFETLGGKGWIYPESVTVTSEATLVVISAMSATEVSVQTQPSGAQMFLISRDMKVPMGKTPFRGKLPVGRMRLRFEKGGYYVLETEIDTRRRREYFFKLRARDMYTIDTVPEKADVYLDGEYIGKAPVEAIVPDGTHTLSFEVDGVEVLKKEEFFGEGVGREKVFSIPSVIELNVLTDPVGAYVEVDGRLSKGPAVFKVIEGKHTIRCWSDGYERVERELVMVRDTLFKCTLKPLEIELRFVGIDSVKVDGMEVEGGVFKTRVGTHVVEMFKGGKRWLLYGWFARDTVLMPLKGMGSVVVPFERFYLDGVEKAGPTVVMLKAGKHSLYSPGWTFENWFELDEGEIVVFPEGMGVVFVVSDPSGIRFVVKDEKGMKSLSTPEMIVGKGRGAIAVMDGCMAGKVFEFEFPDGGYTVVNVGGNCGGGGK